jgi:hypothetical protein
VVLSYSVSITTAPRAFTACRARYGLRSKWIAKGIPLFLKAGKVRNVKAGSRLVRLAFDRRSSYLRARLTLENRLAEFLSSLLFR